MACALGRCGTGRTAGKKACLGYDAGDDVLVVVVVKVVHAHGCKATTLVHVWERIGDKNNEQNHNKKEFYVFLCLTVRRRR